MSTILQIGRLPEIRCASQFTSYASGVRGFGYRPPPSGLRLPASGFRPLAKACCGCRLKAELRQSSAQMKTRFSVNPNTAQQAPDIKPKLRTKLSLPFLFLTCLLPWGILPLAQARLDADLEIEPEKTMQARGQNPGVMDDGRDEASDAVAALHAELVKTADEIRRQAKPFFDKPVEPGSLPVASESLQEKALAQAALQIAKAGDYFNESSYLRENIRAAKALRNAREMLTMTALDSPPAIATYGRIKELAYFARNDRSPQPYYIYRPPDTSPDDKLPLIIFLHGWVPDTSRTNPFLVSDFVLDLADEHGVMLALAHGRTNTDFQYIGEVDVLRVRAEVNKFFNIDSDRIYLLGISMGGAGAWQIGAHYPDLFAGIAPINGQVDWFKFWENNFNYPPRSQLPKHIQQIIAMNNPADLLPNLSNTYTYTQQALTCFIGIEHQRNAVRGLEKIGAEFDYFEDPNPLGHYIYWRKACWERAFKHLLERRLQSNPREVRYKTYSMRYPGTHWARIKRMRQAGRSTAFHVKVDEARPVINLETDNVAEIILTPPEEWADNERRFEVTWNGVNYGRQSLDENGALHLVHPEVAKTTLGSFTKNLKVCGPVPDVFNFPFLAVVGTTGSEDEAAALAKLASRFADDWQAYGEGRIDIIKDTEVTDRQLQNFGLVLFGLPQTNEIIDRIAADLPFALSRRKITLPDGREYATEEHGLLLTYPNPLAPHRYVLIYNGRRWGEGRSPCHRFDRLPDFIIYTEDHYPGIGSNMFRAAGFFDPAWRYDEELTDFN